MNLKQTLDKRKEILKANPEDPLVDSMAAEVMDHIYKNHKEMPIEDIIESLCRLGAAPSVLYDDNGHFTIGGDGSQNLPTTEPGFETRETNFSGTWFVAAGAWKKTIREAIEDHLLREQSDAGYPQEGEK